MFIYRVAEYLPRFRLVEEIRIEPSGASVLAGLVTLSSAELRHVALTEAADVPGQGRLRFASGNVSSMQIRSSEVRLDVNCPADAFLVVGITWSPYWRAEIDGKPARMIRVNHAQMGLKVPAGSTNVSLRYVPPYLPF